MLFEIAEVQLDRYTNEAVSGGFLQTIIRSDITTLEAKVLRHRLNPATDPSSAGAST